MYRSVRRKRKVSTRQCILNLIGPKKIDGLCDTTQIVWIVLGLCRPHAVGLGPDLADGDGPLTKHALYAGEYRNFVFQTCRFL